MPLKKVFDEDKKTCKVTFTLKEEQCKDTEKIFLVGDFNSWSSTETPLVKQKDGSFSVTVELPINREQQFRYLLDDRWENDLEADKYRPSFIGNVDNSVVNTNR